MNEVKRPRKPLIYYYTIVLLVLLLFNFLAMPWLTRRQVQQVDYGTFLEMAENKELGQVEVQQQENQILFTNKENTAIYKTGMMPDPDLTQRLADSGAQFSGEIIEQMSPLLSFLLTWVLPIVIFIGIGQYMSKKLMQRAGGPNSMAFGMGKSNAKVYVKSSEGIKFSDVAGEDEAKENLKEIVDYLHNPNKYKEVGASLACSAETQTQIDRQVVALVKKQHEKARKLLTDNRQKLDELAAYLYEKETITGEEFMSILNA